MKNTLEKHIPSPPEKENPVEGVEREKSEYTEEEKQNHDYIIAYINAQNELRKFKLEAEDSSEKERMYNLFECMQDGSTHKIQSFLQEHNNIHTQTHYLKLALSWKDTFPEFSEQFTKIFFETVPLAELINKEKIGISMFDSQSSELFHALVKEKPELVSAFVETFISQLGVQIQTNTKATVEKLKTQFRSYEGELKVAVDASIEMRAAYPDLAKRLFSVLHKTEEETLGEYDYLNCSPKLAAAFGDTTYIEEHKEKIHENNMKDIGVICADTDPEYARAIIEEYMDKPSGWIGICFPIAERLATKDPATSRMVMDTLGARTGLTYNSMAARIAWALRDKAALEKYTDEFYDFDRHIEKVALEATDRFPDISKKLLERALEYGKRIEDKKGQYNDIAAQIAWKLGDVETFQKITGKNLLSEDESHLFKEVLDTQNNVEFITPQDCDEILQKAIQFHDKEFIAHYGAFLSDEQKVALEKRISLTTETQQLLRKGVLKYIDGAEFVSYDLDKLHAVEPQNEKEKERVRKIEEKILDIEAYKTIVHFTHIANLRNILTEGLLDPESSGMKWGYSGRRDSYMGGSRIFVTEYNELYSIKKWDIPWQQSGPILILFDREKVAEMKFCVGHRGSQLSTGKEIMEKPIDDDPKKWKELKKSSPEHTLHGGGITADVPAALIVSPRRHSLDVGHKQGVEGKVSYSPQQTAEIVTNRMSRLFHKDETANLVPVYDNIGNVIWPRFIPYVEVQRMLEQKNNPQERKEG